MKSKTAIPVTGAARGQAGAEVSSSAESAARGGIALNTLAGNHSGASQARPEDPAQGTEAPPCGSLPPGPPPMPVLGWRGNALRFFRNKVAPHAPELLSSDAKHSAKSTQPPHSAGG